MFRNISFLLILTSIMFVSCDNSTSTSRYYDDGRSKPVLAINTVIDSTSYDLPWSLSEEFSNMITKNLSTNKNIYINDGETVDKLLASENPFTPDISWMKNKFNPNEFVVFLELIKHENQKEKNGTNLGMAMRLRIVDVRSTTPKVVLQESIKDNFFIAKGDFSENYQRVVYGSNEYKTTRMGMAHEHLAKHISDRISDYIALSKSR